MHIILLVLRNPDGLVISVVNRCHFIPQLLAKGVHSNRSLIGTTPGCQSVCNDPVEIPYQLSCLDAERWLINGRFPARSCYLAPVVDKARNSALNY